MGTGDSPAPAQREDGKGTLGNILYDGRGHASVGEELWVELVRSIAAGDQRALRALYERSHRIVFTLIVRIVNSRETAEELTVDVFHDVWRRAAAYDPEGGTVVGWIMNQARSRAIDRLRFEQRKKRVNTSGEAPPGSAPERGPDKMFDVREQGRIVREALALLTPEERQAIETAYFAEMTYHQAATHLKQPLGTVKTRIRSGLAKMRQALQ